jgi:peroxin-7
MRRAVGPVSGIYALWRRTGKFHYMDQVTPAVLHTPGFAHSNIAWSPFHTTRIAVASSANYGIIGNGRLHVASTLPGPSGVGGVRLDKLSV